MPGKCSSTISASPKNSQPSKVLINYPVLSIIRIFLFHLVLVLWGLILQKEPTAFSSLKGCIISIFESLGKA
jgi:hypothetical protein